jgi:nucleotide-binding universal stress UspA family protein
MKKIVVGFDAGVESDDALALGHALAEPDRAQLHVAIVLPRAPVPFEEAIAGGQLSEQLDRELYASATRQLGGSESVRANLDGARAGRSAARALYEYAEEREADLIVVGSSHRGKLGRALIGSVAESLLRGAPCAVAVAPRGFARREHHGFDLIGVAYDGSPEADLALQEAELLSHSLEARLRLIAVVPPTSAIGPQVDELERRVLRRAYRGILEWGASKLAEGAQQETVLVEGDPAKILADQGSQLDLLVLGSRGYGAIRGALLGAVSSGVIRTASCPVLVTPRGLAGDSPADTNSAHRAVAKPLDVRRGASP